MALWPNSRNQEYDKSGRPKIPPTSSSTTSYDSSTTSSSYGSVLTMEDLNRAMGNLMDNECTKQQQLQHEMHPLHYYYQDEMVSITNSTIGRACTPKARAPLSPHKAQILKYRIKYLMLRYPYLDSLVMQYNMEGIDIEQRYELLKSKIQK